MNKTITTLTICAIIISFVYLLRTTIDIGCANTPVNEARKEKSIARNFMGINCWFWEGTFQINGNL